MKQKSVENTDECFELELPSRLQSRFKGKKTELVCIAQDNRTTLKNGSELKISPKTESLFKDCLYNIEYKGSPVSDSKMKTDLSQTIMAFNPVNRTGTQIIATTKRSETTKNRELQQRQSKRKISLIDSVGELRSSVAASSSKVPQYFKFDANIIEQILPTKQTQIYPFTCKNSSNTLFSKKGEEFIANRTSKEYLNKLSVTDSLAINFKEFNTPSNNSSKYKHSQEKSFPKAVLLLNNNNNNQKPRTGDNTRQIVMGGAGTPMYKKKIDLEVGTRNLAALTPKSVIASNNLFRKKDNVFEKGGVSRSTKISPKDQCQVLSELTVHDHCLYSRLSTERDSRKQIEKLSRDSKLKISNLKTMLMEKDDLIRQLETELSSLRGEVIFYKGRMIRPIDSFYTTNDMNQLDNTQGMSDSVQSSFSKTNVSEDARVPLSGFSNKRRAPTNIQLDFPVSDQNAIMVTTPFPRDGMSIVLPGDISSTSTFGTNAVRKSKESRVPVPLPTTKANSGKLTFKFDLSDKVISQSYESNRLMSSNERNSIDDRPPTSETSTIKHKMLKSDKTNPMKIRLKIRNINNPFETKSRYNNNLEDSQSRKRTPKFNASESLVIKREKNKHKVKANEADLFQSSHSNKISSGAQTSVELPIDNQLFIKRKSNSSNYLSNKTQKVIIKHEEPKSLNQF